MSACLTCPATDALHQVGQQATALRRRLTALRRLTAKGLGSLSVIGLAIVVLGLASASTVAAAAAPLIDLFPVVVGLLVR